jgi:hypothetical protein
MGATILDRRHATIFDPRSRSASRGTDLGFRLMRLYSRLVGGIQFVYAGFFGWIAFDRWMSGRFYNPETFFKGGHLLAYYDFDWLIYTLIYALISLCGFIGAFGLLGLRPWARRWEVAYLGVLSLGVAVRTVELLIEMRSTSLDFTALGLFFLALALPSVPFLFGVVSGALGATPLYAPGKKMPVIEWDGVRDRELDG